MDRLRSPRCSGIALRVGDIPPEARPREKLAQKGAAALSDAELLAILIGSGVRGSNALQVAERVLERFNGLESLEKGGYVELCEAGIKGLGPVRAINIAAALELGRRWQERQGAVAGRDGRLRSPERVVDFLLPFVRRAGQESFWVVPVDVKLAPLLSYPLEVSRGVVDSALCHPREVFGPAIRCGAARVYVAHNHPSGDATPSVEDVEVTRRLVEAGRIVGVPLMDHLVVGSCRGGGADWPWTSLRRAGLVVFE